MRKCAIANAWLFFSASVFVSAAREVHGLADQGAALKERVTKELPVALARIEAVYSHVVISGTMTEEKRLMSPTAGPEARGDDPGRRPTGRPPGDLESTSSRKFVLQASNGLLKSSRNTIFDKYYDKESHSLRDKAIAPLDPAKSVACVGRDYSFRLRWEKDNPILMSLGTTGDEDAENTVRAVNRILRAPCGAFAGPTMLRTMSFPSFAVRNVTRTPGQNGDNLLIDFEFDLADDKNVTISKRRNRAPAAQGKALSTGPSKWKGWIEVSPNDGWAVQAYGGGEGAGRATSIHQEIAYGEHRDGLPLPRRITWFEPVRATTRWLDIESIEFGRRPESEYTLSFYGIPEIGASPRARGENRLAVVIFLFAFVAFSVALALKFYAKRLRKE